MPIFLFCFHLSCMRTNIDFMLLGTLWWKILEAHHVNTVCTTSTKEYIYTSYCHFVFLPRPALKITLPFNITHEFVSTRHGYLHCRLRGASSNASYAFIDVPADHSDMPGGGTIFRYKDFDGVVYREIFNPRDPAASSGLPRYSPLCTVVPTLGQPTTIVKSRDLLMLKYLGYATTEQPRYLEDIPRCRYVRISAHPAQRGEDEIKCITLNSSITCLVSDDQHATVKGT
ncbi:uncharacterized protein EV420DRAFT_1142951 [Desarmillaria tabescens]|uniref:Uncharacterized protein n=1 Tax=Armillaria tabescens TaxID=1929756 RepID=A0AA39T3Z0_ARMTA|nr:uncharacterized protein EV420DRAFT_1142951 [Desarmillaria tabescens]KAK0462881.1 hypothetical protein EV420DRAFT_1142951 [Desarmillaria tabescens]